MSEKTSNFEFEVTRFQQFLRASQRSEKIVWIDPHDLLLTGRRELYVKIPASESGEIAARKAFEKGITLGRGVLFKAVSEVNGSSFCCVWIPRSNDEASLALMPAGIKLSIRDDKIPMTMVENWFLWLCLRIRFCRKQAHKKELFR